MNIKMKCANNWFNGEHGWGGSSDCLESKKTFQEYSVWTIL